MPQLIFKGIKKEHVEKFSKELVEELATISETPLDYFTLEVPQTSYVANGAPFEMFPLVEVIQFERSAPVERQMAICIAQKVKDLGYSVCEVYYIHLEKKDYYEF